ncbi:trace amine-associated receptor 8c-like [Anneissia japonica]|uniref:trace amine-associated receptor 8c-like n=1 Tax=Anneissia japonica TaxID=1529436 RepID=UPI00142586D8|nr:trace amine-associated receptor 8c-like [Anneissia japonica]
MDEFASIRNVTTINEYRDNLIFVLTVYIPLALVIICGNAFVLIVIRRTPTLHESQFTLLASLAFVDLLTGIIGIPIFMWEYVTRESLYLQNIDDCELQYIPMKLFIGTSFLHLLFITADRYVSIVKPLKYEQIVTQSRIYCAIAISWITACGYVSVPFLWKSKRIGEKFLCYQMNREGIAAQRYVVLTMVPTGVILLIFMYVCIFMEARKLSSIVHAENTVGITVVRKNFKAAKTSALIVCLFIVAYFPYSLRVVIFSLGFQRSDVYWYELITEVSLSISSAVNPFIYVFRHRQFSTALRHLLRKRTEFSISTIVSFDGR